MPSAARTRPRRRAPRRSRVAPEPRGAAARRRLLDAALQVFAEQGFRRGTVRAVCGRAGTDSGAANYHFGSKTGLYRAVLAEAFERVRRDTPLDTSVLPPRDTDAARARLRTAVQAFASGLLVRRPPAHALLLFREMVEPTPAIEDLVERLVRPRVDVLRAAVRALMPGAPEREVAWATVGVVAQVAYHRSAGPVVLRLLGERAYGPALVREVVDRVVAFSERAIGVRDGVRFAP